MPALTAICGVCKSEVTVSEAFIPKMTGKTQPCPVCDSPLLFPAPAAPPVEKPFIAGKPVRLTCPQCAAQFTLSFDTASKMAGSTMKCLKCDKEIPLPSVDVSSTAPSTTISPSSTNLTPPPARRKCSGCLSLIEGEIVFCPTCGTRLDDHKTTISSGSGTRLKVQVAEGLTPPPIPCVKCKRMIDHDTVVCPHCKTNQTSGYRNRPDSRPIGWKRDPIQYSKIGKLVHNIGIVFFALVLLALLIAGGLWFYKFILTQMPEG